MGVLIFGYKISSAAASSQIAGDPIDVAVFPISGHTQSRCIGALAMCMYAWDPHSNKWIPYVAT
jgi:hypothetical protein